MAVSNLNPLVNLANVSFALIERYLGAANFKKVYDDPADVTVFEISNGQQILFPRNKNFKDFDRVSKKAIIELSLALGKDESDLILDLVSPSDIIHIRVDDKVTECGTIPLGLSNNITALSQQLIREEAQRVIYKAKTNKKTNKKTVVRKFVDGCRFGQTKVGSYLYSVVLPLGIDNINYQASLDCPYPISRTVFMELFKDIEKSITATDTVEGEVPDEVWNLFVEDKKIVTSLMSLEIPSDDGKIEILPVPSTNIPMPKDIVKPVSISNKQIKKMQYIAAQVYKNDLSRQSTYIGKIDKLMGREHKDGGREGEVGFTTIGPNNKAIKAKLFLNPVDYLRANKSHGSNDFVSVTGLLVKTGSKTYEIQDISEFKILDRG